MCDKSPQKYALFYWRTHFNGAQLNKTCKPDMRLSLSGPFIWTPSHSANNNAQKGLGDMCAVLLAA